MKINRVTMTGADDSIHNSHLIELSRKYPFVEWGILVSERSMGSRRFPSKKWIDQLCEAKKANPQMKLSMHVCGKWVREMLLGNFNIFSTFDSEMYDCFERVQLNTHASPHEHAISAFEIMANHGQEYIIQYDGVNISLLDSAQLAGTKHATLFDMSHGAGILPESWPKPIDGLSCGYAGGLSPENVKGQIEELNKQLPEETVIWIDMETHIRSASTAFALPNEHQFDMGKVEQVLKICVDSGLMAS